MALLAFVLRAGRRRLGSGPAALASNAWGVMGLAPVVLAPPLVAGLRASRVLREDNGIEATVTAAIAAFVVYGHAAMVDPARRVYAGRAARKTLQVGLAVVGALLIVLVGQRLISGFSNVPVLVAFSAGLAVLLYERARPLVRRAFAPYGGRWLDAFASIEARLRSTASLDQLGEVVLPPLREAASEPDAAPRLFLLDPPRELWIDAAGDVASPFSLRSGGACSLRDGCLARADADRCFGGAGRARGGPSPGGGSAEGGRRRRDDAARERRASRGIAPASPGPSSQRRRRGRGSGGRLPRRPPRSDRRFAHIGASRPRA